MDALNVKLFLREPLAMIVCNMEDLNFTTSKSLFKISSKARYLSVGNGPKMLTYYIYALADEAFSTLLASLIRYSRTGLERV